MMRFEVNHVVCCPPMLTHGQAQRVPRDFAKPMVGYHYACPFCRHIGSFVSLAMDAGCGVEVKEESTFEGPSLTIPPLACVACRKAFRVEAGAVVALPPETLLRACGCVEKGA